MQAAARLASFFIDGCLRRLALRAGLFMVSGGQRVLPCLQLPDLGCWVL